MLEEARELLAIQSAILYERANLPLSKFCVVLPSAMYNRLCSEGGTLFGCEVIKSDMLGSTEVMVSRKFDIGELI